MTEYEFVTARELISQSMAALTDAQASYIAIYLSMVFAYTTVAFIAGKQLSRIQVSIVTVIYFLTSVYVVMVIVAMTKGLTEMQVRMEEHIKGANAISDVVALSLWLDLVLWPLAMLASLLFMWNVRREGR